MDQELLRGTRSHDREKRGLTGKTADWRTPLNTSSNYAAEATSVAKDGGNWLAARSKVAHRAIVLDVDDTTLTTWNYELFSNWDFNPTTNGYFVGLTGNAFTGNSSRRRPAWSTWSAGQARATRSSSSPGRRRRAARGDDREPRRTTPPPGCPNIGCALRACHPRVDAGYQTPTLIDTGHGGFEPTGSSPSRRSARIRPYLERLQFCADASSPGPRSPARRSSTSPATRAYIESQGYDIVANFGDQFSDLEGGYADKTFKMPNPNYYLP